MKELKELKELKEKTSYDVSSIRLTLLNGLYAPNNSFLQSVSNIFSRLDSFAHILIWTKETVTTDDMGVSPDIIELPRLGLTFRRNRKDGKYQKNFFIFTNRIVSRSNT